MHPSNAYCLATFACLSKTPARNNLAKDQDIRWRTACSKNSKCIERNRTSWKQPNIPPNLWHVRVSMTMIYGFMNWWKIFCDSATCQTHGPFGKLVEQVSSLGLRLSSEGRLWFSDNGYIDVFVASETLLRRILLQAFHDSQVPQVGHRKDYTDLEGCDVNLTTFWDHTLTVQELECVNIARDGAFVCFCFKCRQA